jgi:hypothetical protein
MTRISYIHAIPGDEIAQRSAEIRRTSNYLPYTQLTAGEMYLSLLGEQARMLAAFYPEYRYLSNGSDMIDNALSAGLHKGISFVGSVPTELQNVARAITSATRLSSPATGQFLTERNQFTGIKIGETPIVPMTSEDCEDYATRKANQKYGLERTKFWWKALPVGGQKGHWKIFEAECKVKKEIEQILNKSITGSAHHITYKQLNGSNPLISGLFTRTKALLHVAGVGALGNAAEVGKGLMDAWTETAIMRQNAALSFGPVDSVITGLSLAPDAPDFAGRYFEAQGGEKWRTGPKIGIAVATIAAVTALVTAIAAAVGKAAEMQKELNAKKSGVMAAAQGFGTEAFRADASDYTGNTNNNTGNNVLPFVLAGAAAIFLLKD